MKRASLATIKKLASLAYLEQQKAAMNMAESTNPQTIAAYHNACGKCHAYEAVVRAFQGQIIYMQIDTNFREV